MVGKKILLPWCNFLWQIASVTTVPWRHIGSLDFTLCFLGLDLVEIAPFIPFLPHFNHFGKPAYVSHTFPYSFLSTSPAICSPTFWVLKNSKFKNVCACSFPGMLMSIAEIKFHLAARWWKGLAKGEPYQSSPEKTMKSHCAHNGKIHL